MRGSTNPDHNGTSRVPPILTHAGIARFFNGPESFTPDAMLMLGEAPRNPGCFVAAGLNSE
jgi:4-methylaminobutanoate oxidase (formaldehyde-forming)